MRPILPLAIVLALSLPPTAFAGTASVSPMTDRPSTLSYTAAPGERNQITLTLVGNGIPYDIVVRDAGAAVVAGPGCRALDERAVRCADPVIKPSVESIKPYFGSMISIDAGDGDDTVSVPTEYAYPTSVYGGDGHDALTGVGGLHGGPGNDVLTGGDSSLTGHKGNDPVVNSLEGGPGDDVLRGGRGEAVFSGDGAGLTSLATLIAPDPGGGDDVMVGGPGGGSVSYAGRSAGVRVDLADTKGFHGAPGERDRISAIGSVTGGDGDDVLLGDEAHNDLHGGPGDDRLIGRAGNDDITGAAGSDVLDGRAGTDDLDGGPGRDTLRGGAGNDDLVPGAGDVLEGGAGRDRFLPGPARALNCGSGHDIVAAPRGALFAGCEMVLVGADVRSASVDTLSVAARPQRRPGGVLRFPWSCDGSGGRCDLKLTVRRGSTRIGSRSALILGRGEAGTIVIRPRRRLRGGQLLDVAVAGSVLVSQGVPWLPSRLLPVTARWRIRL